MNVIQRIKKKFPNFNSLVVVIGVVLVWRGIWHIADMYLLPDNDLYSSIAGIIIGIMLLLVDDLRLNELTEVPAHSHDEQKKPVQSDS